MMEGKKTDVLRQSLEVWPHPQALSLALTAAAHLCPVLAAAEGTDVPCSALLGPTLPKTAFTQFYGDLSPPCLEGLAVA